MKTCALCSTPLKFLNTPLAGSSKLTDGGVLCSRCVGKVGYSVSVKNHSLESLQAFLAQKETGKQEKIVQAAQQKVADEEAKKIKEEQKAIQEAENKQQRAEQKAEKNAAMEARLQEMKAEEIQKKQTLDELKAHIKTLPIDNISSFLGRKEINELPNILSPDEKLDNLIQGRYNDGQGILVSTDRRLVFIDKGLLFGLKVEDFPLDKISSIQFETGILMGKVKIHTSGNMACIDDVSNSDARQFSGFVRDKLSRPVQKEVAQTVIVQQQQPDVLEQLEKLGKLKAAGVLSDAEFDEQKAKLLAKL